MKASVARVRDQLRVLTQEGISREISDRCDAAHGMKGAGKVEALSFNALLVTALNDGGIWPRDARVKPGDRKSAFDPPPTPMPNT